MTDLPIEIQIAELELDLYDCERLRDRVPDVEDLNLDQWIVTLKSQIAALKNGNETKP